MSNYNFGEKKTEYNAKLGKECEVWQTPKYLEAKKKAIETIESENLKGVIVESDFWILMNATKSGKMAYTGLILSHNGCLKINDAMPDGKKFVPESVTLDKDGYNNSLVYSYCNNEQGLYEVGEVSAKNCTNAYPYAMALKRCFDRVVLKLSKLAYSGIYSDSESEEFTKPDTSTPETATNAATTASKTAAKKTPEPITEEIQTAFASVTAIQEKTPASKETKQAFVDFCKENGIDVISVCKQYKLNNDATEADFLKALNYCKLSVKIEDINGGAENG